MNKPAHDRRMEDVNRLRRLWYWIKENPNLTTVEISLKMNYDVGKDLSYLLSKNLIAFQEPHPYKWSVTQHKFYDVRH